MARVVTIPIGPIYMGGGCRGLIHVIRQGDTLYKLGKQYHVSVSSLMYANPYVNVYNLQVGDELCIPSAYPVGPAGYPMPGPTGYPAPGPTGYPAPGPSAYPVTVPSAYPVGPAAGARQDGDPLDPETQEEGMEQAAPEGEI